MVQKKPIIFMLYKNLTVSQHTFLNIWHGRFGINLKFGASMQQRICLSIRLALTIVVTFILSACDSSNNLSTISASISTTATPINMIETDITVTNTGSSNINSINAALVGSFTGLTIYAGNTNPCQNISMVNPLPPNGQCTLKLNNTQTNQAINNTEGTLVITPNNNSALANTFDVISGTYLFAGGAFSTAGGNSAPFIAAWNGSTWVPLSTGMNGIVAALAVVNNILYAGGQFSTAGGLTVNQIAKWNGTEWSALGSGMSGGSAEVDALSVSGNNLYVGGEFTAAGGASANNLAMWNGSSWSAVSTGTNALVAALVNLGAVLYAGGNFTTAGGVTVSHVARWDGSAWSTLLGGTSGGGGAGDIFALNADSSTGNLYAGGSFTTAGVTSANNIAYWNDQSNGWSAMGTGTNGTNGPVHSLRVQSGNVYAGGNFTQAGGVTVNNIAQWNGSSWSAMGTGTNGNVEGLTSGGSNVYAGGNFTQAGGNTVNFIAVWNGTAWAALGTGMDADAAALVIAPSLQVLNGVNYVHH